MHQHPRYPPHHPQMGCDQEVPHSLRPCTSCPGDPVWAWPQSCEGLCPPKSFSSQRTAPPCPHQLLPQGMQPTVLCSPSGLNVLEVLPSTEAPEVLSRRMKTCRIFPPKSAAIPQEVSPAPLRCPPPHFLSPSFGARHHNLLRGLFVKFLRGSQMKL